MAQLTPKTVEAATASFDKTRWSYPVEFEWKAIECDTESDDYKKCEVSRFLTTLVKNHNSQIFIQLAVTR